MTTLVPGTTSVTSPSNTIDAADLRELMQAVSETTERLQQTHVTLQGEVGRLKQELASANARLRRSEALAALGEMAAGIAHEIRNPLGSIHLYLGMLAEDVASSPDATSLCTKIEHAVVGMNAIVNDVLAFARDRRLAPVETSASILFDRVLSSMTTELAQATITVHQRDDAGLFVGDAVLLTQAISNVVRNAVQAMAETPETDRSLALHATRQPVRLPSGERGDRVVIAVEDNGPGIPRDVVDRMFNPFFTTRATGTGLGLAIVHRIVDGHDGHVHVAPREHGTRIELVLPPEGPQIAEQVTDAIHASPESTE